MASLSVTDPGLTFSRLITGTVLYTGASFSQDEKSMPRAITITNKNVALLHIEGEGSFIIERRVIAREFCRRGVTVIVHIVSHIYSSARGITCRMDGCHPCREGRIICSSIGYS